MKKMLIESRLFGTVAAEAEKMVRFGQGIAGLRSAGPGGCAEYLLHKDPGTWPIQWLLGTRQGAPEIPVADPSLFEPEYESWLLGLPQEVLRQAGAREADELDLHAVVTVPGDVSQMSMNLRAPIAVNRRTGQAAQISSSALRDWPARRLIWPDLAHASIPADATALHVLEVDADEGVDVGSRLTVRASALDGGAARLQVIGPEAEAPSRRGILAVPAVLNRLASEADARTVRRLEGLLGCLRERSGESGRDRGGEPATYPFRACGDVLGKDVDPEMAPRWMPMAALPCVPSSAEGQA